jgi:hypothetical protein
MNSSYPGAPGRGGTSLGMPPAQVGQVSETNPENEPHAPSVKQTQSAAVNVHRRLVVPTVKFEPRCSRPRTCKITCKITRQVVTTYPTRQDHS